MAPRRRSGMKDAEAAAGGRPRCRGEAARASARGSCSSFGARRRGAHPAASGWTAGPCVSGPAGCLRSLLHGPWQKLIWSSARGAPGVFLPSPHTCRRQPGLLMSVQQQLKHSYLLLSFSFLIIHIYMDNVILESKYTVVNLHKELKDLAPRLNQLLKCCDYMQAHNLLVY